MTASGSRKITTAALILAIAAAASLWFYMFSPWTAGLTNFWLTMTAAACVLTAMATAITRGDIWKDLLKCEKPIFQIFMGVAIAFALWGVFWIGDFLSSRMFDFARPEVDAVYSMKDGFPAWIIALLLLSVIGPAEEIFWRGFVQRQLREKLSERERLKNHSTDLAFLITLLIYALVHIWSLNFMLVMAALVAGAVWGFIYRLKPAWLPALVVSHALWDALVFVIFPI